VVPAILDRSLVGGRQVGRPAALPTGTARIDILRSRADRPASHLQAPLQGRPPPPLIIIIDTRRSRRRGLLFDRVLPCCRSLHLRPMMLCISASPVHCRSSRCNKAGAWYSSVQRPAVRAILSEAARRRRSQW